MKQIKVYQTSDGQTFNERVPAENHELMLKIRGIIQRHVKGDSFSPTELARIVVSKNDEVFETLSKYRKVIAGVKSSKVVN